MFRQNEVYIPTEYGTRECKEWREPCGAFYGLPYSGEVSATYIEEQEQIYAFLPDTHFSKRDERRLAHMRGELTDEEMVEPKPKAPIRENPYIVRELVTDFKYDTQAPADVVAQYHEIAKRYANGDRYLLAKLHDMYQLWMSRR